MADLMTIFHLAPMALAMEVNYGKGNTSGLDEAKRLLKVTMTSKVTFTGYVFRLNVLWRLCSILKSR